MLLAVAIVPVSCTELGGWSVIDVDCGSTEDPHTKYEAAGRECVWDAYSRGRSAKWVVTWRTIEGDPIPRTIRSAARTAVC